jgi:UDP-glucose 4-epimerase
LSKVKVVLTGGAGFIGSHIAEYWSDNDADIHIIDNLRSGYKKNLEGLKGVTFHEGSITNKDLVYKVLEGADYVHHLAAMISVPESVLNPYECVDINVYGLLNVLEAAKAHKIKKVMHSSSAAIYGDNPASPKTVQMLPAPKSPYGITKLDGEFYLQMYYESFGLQTVSLRNFNVFGPRQDPKSQYAAAIPIFVAKALKNEPIIIYGDGEQTRDFVYVKDVVQANILAATTPDVTGVFNVACGEAITINTLANLVLKLTNSKSQIIYKEERPGDIKHSLASIEETKKKLNFSPKFNLMDGLEITIKYFIELFK